MKFKIILEVFVNTLMLWFHNPSVAKATAPFTQGGLFLYFNLFTADEVIKPNGAVFV